MEKEAIELKNKKKREMPIRIKWVVNPYRKDKRTGIVNPPAIRDKWFNYLWNEIEEQFKK